MEIIFKRIIIGTGLLLISYNVTGLDLRQAYELAKRQDPTFLSAKETFKSSLESMPQARADLFPTISASVGTKGINSDFESSGQKYSKYNNSTHSLSLSMPVIDYSLWVNYEKARETIKAAHATIYAAEQDLLIRVSTQYFNVLKARDDLNLAKAQEKAFSRFLEQSEEKFKVGLIAITDVHEAKARRDDAIAEVIAAANSYEDQKEILREIVGQRVDSLKTLDGIIDLISPQPMDVNQWVERATRQNHTLVAAKHNLEVTRKDITDANAKHLPTLNLSGNVTSTTNVPRATPRRYDSKEIGLTLSIPLFQGGRVMSEQRQAAYDYQAARHNYNRTLRETQSGTRQAFRGVITQISRVKALEQAVISSVSALQATEAAFDVGTRTVVDVLDAQTALLNAQKNLSASKYDYLLETLSLKQSAGILSSGDLIYINSVLYDDANKHSTYSNKDTKKLVTVPNKVSRNKYSSNNQNISKKISVKNKVDKAIVKNKNISKIKKSDNKALRVKQGLPKTTKLESKDDLELLSSISGYDVMYREDLGFYRANTNKSFLTKSISDLGIITRSSL